MPLYADANFRSRAHWSGANADVDIHLELFEANIEHGFLADSWFQRMNWSKHKSVNNQSNTYRRDFMGGIGVRYRKSGDQSERQRIINEKTLYQVDTTVYAQHIVDWNDDWTSPDWAAEYGREHAHAHALQYDEAHMIQLIKAGAWQPPTSLQSRYYGGTTRNMNGYNGASDEQRAELIVQNHRALVTLMTKRRLDKSRLITLMDPEQYSVLMEHRKLMSTEFNSTGGGGYGDRVVHRLNGVPVVECPLFPQAAQTQHPFGQAFNLSAEQANSRVIIFDPTKTLLTLEAKPMSGVVVDKPEDFHTIWSTFRMYNVGVLDGSTVGVLRTAA